MNPGKKRTLVCAATIKVADQKGLHAVQSTFSENRFKKECPKFFKWSQEKIQEEWDKHLREHKAGVDYEGNPTVFGKCFEVQNYSSGRHASS